MIYFALGHLWAASIFCSALFLLKSSSLLIILITVALLGEILVGALLGDDPSNGVLKTAIQSHIMSKWLPFFFGAGGAALWMSATILTWTVCLRYQSKTAIGVSIVLTMIGMCIGTAGAVAAVGCVAKRRLSISAPQK